MDGRKQLLINEIKEKKFFEQGGRCGCIGCKAYLRDPYFTHLSHRIPQRKWALKKWGEEIIHHELNMILTCPNDRCNSAVQISPHKTELVNEHIARIKEALEIKPDC